MADVVSIYNILLANKYQERLFSDLGRAKREGRELLADCPFCGKGKHFSFSMDKPLWKCWSCGEAGDWIKYIMTREGISFKEALVRLGREAGVDVSQVDEARYIRETRKANILESAQDIFKKALFEPEGKAELKYLLDRGYNEQEIKAMGLGSYTDRDEIQSLLYLDGYSKQEIKDSGILTQGFGQDYTITVPVRDKAGRAIGLAGRPIYNNEELEAKGLSKYKYSAGVEIAKGLFGYESARGAYKVIIVEGLLDAVLLSSKGEPVVALGGTSMSAEKLKALEEAGTQELILVLDRDQAGQKATEDISRNLVAGIGLRPYVLTLPEGYKDPDELVRAQGIEAFQELTDKAERASRWLARRIVSKHDLNTEKGLDGALAEALLYGAGIRDGINKRAFMEELAWATGIVQEDMADRQARYEEEASRIEQEKALQESLRKIEGKAREHDLKGVEKELAQALGSLQMKKQDVSWNEYRIPGMEEWVDLLSNEPEGYKTGFDTLDSKVRIKPGGISIVAGRPGQGKTSLLLNMLCNMMRLYQDKEFYFFTYEMGWKDLQLDLLMIMAGKVLGDGSFCQGAYRDYLRDEIRADSDINKALKEMESLLASGRLRLIDERVPAEELTRRMRGLAGRPIGGIFIDYIQRIPVDNRAGQRYLEIKEVSAQLLDQAIALEAPVIMGAQLGRPNKGQGESSIIKLSNLRESGDIEQDAHLVLGLYNKTVDERDQAGAEEDIWKDDIKKAVDLEVHILKNRNGVAGRKCILEFNMPILKIQDKKTVAGGSSLR